MANREKPVAHSFTKALLATFAFAAVHSAAASLTAKRTAHAAFGQRHTDGLYRFLYLGQSLVTFSALVTYIASLPRENIFEAGRPTRFFFRVSQAAVVGCVAWAGISAGFLRITGLENFLAWRRGGAVPPMPIAQGPERDSDGQLPIRGPFQRQRHPLNFWFLPVFWLNPTLTSRRLGFNVAASAYLVVGSWLEEQRLIKAYGPQYKSYQNSGTNFFLPYGAQRKC